MPHYKDGTEAKIGDLVKGRGYNVKHEIIGKVVNIRPGESCTLTVAHVGKDTDVYFRFAAEVDRPEAVDASRPFTPCVVYASLEFGDTKGFEKIG